MATFRFIKPSEPIEQNLPPAGGGYLIECKWDGFRIQLHKQGNDVHVFSRNGKWLPRFKPILEPVSRLPVKSTVIDAEFVALNAKGLPDFRALVGGQSQSLVCFCFDLLMLNGKDMRPLPLVKRRQALQKLLAKAAIPEIAFSEAQDNPNALLDRLDAIGMEGIVCKLKNQPYVSGKNRGWIKVKCHAWRKANASRNKLFTR